MKAQIDQTYCKHAGDVAYMSEASRFIERQKEGDFACL